MKVKELLELVKKDYLMAGKLLHHDAFLNCEDWEDWALTTLVPSAYEALLNSDKIDQDLANNSAVYHAAVHRIAMGADPRVILADVCRAYEELMEKFRDYVMKCGNRP